MPLLDVSSPDNNDNPYPWVEQIQKAMWHGFWTAEKFSFDSDLKNFRHDMTPLQRQVTVRTLCAIAQIEVKVKAFWAYLGLHVKDETIAGGGITMAGVEEIHHDAYKKLLLKLGLHGTLKDMLRDTPALAGRVAYLSKHTKSEFPQDQRKQFIYSLILFTIFVENVSLFSQFYTILYLNREHGILKDTSQQVKYTRNEETLHAQFGMKIIQELRREYPECFDEEMKARVLRGVGQAYDAESNLIDWFLEGFDEPELNPVVLKSYVKMRLNESLEGVGYEPVYQIDPDHAAKTFWMKVGVLTPPKVDFFHGEPTTYVQADASDDDDF
jgi:ribonucleoside-diphosphate reductase beta chain